MKVIVLIDPEAALPDDPDLRVGDEESRQEVEFHVTETLRELGHTTTVQPVLPSIPDTIHALMDASPDLVFNLTEHYLGDRRMDKNIAGVLDLLQLPYTGSGPDGLMLCRDKGLCKRLLAHRRIRVPNFVMIPPGQITVRKKLQFPVIVKPGFEDGSDGISLASLVDNEADMKERVAMLHERMKQPVICEEFIDGREIYIGMVGNQRVRAFPAREVRFGVSDHGPRFATAKVKRDEAYRQKWDISFTHAELPPELEERAARVGKRIFRMLQLRDYGRVDFRITPENELVFLEANPNPDLTMGDEVAEAADKAGLTYSQLIAHIVSLALRRTGRS